MPGPPPEFFLQAVNFSATPAVKALEKKFGFKGYAFISKTIEVIYANSGKLPFNKNVLELFSKKLGIPEQEILEMISICLEHGAFDVKMYNENKLISSPTLIARARKLHVYHQMLLKAYYPDAAVTPKKQVYKKPAPAYPAPEIPKTQIQDHFEAVTEATYKDYTRCHKIKFHDQKPVLKSVFRSILHIQPAELATAGNVKKAIQGWFVSGTGPDISGLLGIITKNGQEVNNLTKNIQIAESIP